MVVLVGGVGYTFLRDHSAGLGALDRLRALPWPPNVRIEDLSYSPIAVVHHLRETLGPQDRLILIGAVKRDRLPGGIYIYRWDAALPPAEEVQARVVEAVTGVVSLENLLVIAAQFQALPRDILVIEVEPEDESWGPGFTPQVEDAIDRVVTLVQEDVLGCEVPDGRAL